MADKEAIGDEEEFDKRFLRRLLEDPTRSVRALASDLGSYRQKVWRHKRRLEQDHVVWGYTAVVDEAALGNVMYMVLMKMKPLDRQLAELIIRRQTQGEFHKQRVRLLNVLYVNGEYDWLIMFSAPDHATARRYYDSIRVSYADFLLDRPVIIDVNFPVIREGKINPELKRLYDFVPV
jgi:DNA-binding Lrp family transcriptional regulator